MLLKSGKPFVNQPDCTVSGFLATFDDQAAAKTFDQTRKFGPAMHLISQFSDC
jgi:hypothetical protein